MEVGYDRFQISVKWHEKVVFPSQLYEHIMLFLEVSECVCVESRQEAKLLSSLCAELPESNACHYIIASA